MGLGRRGRRLAERRGRRVFVALDLILPRGGRWGWRARAMLLVRNLLITLQEERRAEVWVAGRGDGGRLRGCGERLFHCVHHACRGGHRSRECLSRENGIIVRSM